MTKEAMLSAFLSGARKDIFHSVEHRHQIWRENPFDVENVHAEARAVFQRLLAQATTPPGMESGRILLLLGESGCGKTHLVRSFRNYVHFNGLGFVGYMQMTTATSNYGRYLISNLVDSLDQPYYESLGPGSGLLRLSNAVAARCEDRAAVRAIVESDKPEMVLDLVERAADRLISQPRYAELDLDLIRALLLLQRQDSALRKRVIKYLRCEDLTERDAQMIGMTPRRNEDDAQRLVEQLGRLTWAFDSRALVICVDQFEDVYQVEDASNLFRRAMSSLCAVADQVPSAIIVISCLVNYYEALKPRLTRSTLDRVEHDPTPVRLNDVRTAEEVEELIRQRLAYLYDSERIKDWRSNGDLLYPFPRELVDRLSGLRMRDILNECQKFRDDCITAGKVLGATPAVAPVQKTDDEAGRRFKAAKEKIEQEWNDYLSAYRDDPPESEYDITEIFAWALHTCGHELESEHRFEVHQDENTIDVRLMVPVGKGHYKLGEEILVAICNKDPRGGGLRNQLEAAKKLAKKRTLVIVRCAEFPSNPAGQASQILTQIIKKGGRKVVLEESDLRKIAAFRQFRGQHEGREHFMAWLMEENHLSRLLPLIHVLDLDNLDRFEPLSEKRPPRVSVPPSPSPSPSPPQPEETPPVNSTPAPPSNTKIPSPPPPPPVVESAPAGPSALIALGNTGELITQSLTIESESLTAHAAFLGGTGSGKTTLALNVIEQLLEQGVPAILVDRKGDLASYARETIFRQPHADAALEARRRRLADRLDIALFTPGRRDGRQLALSLMPRGLGALKDLDRDQAAGFAAHALADMLQYRQARKDKGLRVIIAQAFQIFASHGRSDSLDLDTLIHFIAGEDNTLVNALGHLDTRLFKDLVHDLEVLRQSTSELFHSTGEALDAEVLLGLGAHARPGRTRLSVISTRFLGGEAQILFWVSQLLLSLTRWVTRAPTPRLQAVVLFDEADVYLPAQSQPATKAPMENLLRRARSGGLGLLLATQSPGDLDYKCRDNIRSWFVGRVTQTVALEKMRPLLNEARVNVDARIPAQSPGDFHLLQEGRVTAFKGGFPLLRAEQVPEAEILDLAASRRQRG